ncbi:TIGR04255 family protein [Mycolicibacterium neoaurum]|nr:TIGR04255 family protein [Mycolicibacterium neoaurum]
MSAVAGVATRREYPNPPIVEVVCQVAFAEPVHWSAASPGLLYGEIRGEYPAEPKAQTAIEAEINGETSNFQVARGAQRFVYSNDEQNRRLVANESHLSVNALAPDYEQWDSLAERFQRAMSSFERAIAKFTPKTVSLRYINKIVVPSREVNLSTYFTVPIVVSHREGATLTNFVSRSQSLAPDGVGITVTFGSAVGHEADNESAFILDIDLDVAAPADADFDRLCALAAELHRWENNEFESSITAKCRELFE